LACSWTNGIILLADIEVRRIDRTISTSEKE
jgi:hypothetical protein